MNIEKPCAVIGTNSWGSAAYEKLIRGEAVDNSVIQEAVKEAVQQDLIIFDTAQDYGFGQGQKMVGEYCLENETFISAKFTPVTRYKKGQVKASLEKDLKDFKRESIDIYWLHLPNDIEDNLTEMMELYQEGKIKRIGISNFNLEECKKAKEILNQSGIPLYGVQNHFSLLDRTWEENGLIQWCEDNNISFWAWAVLEEGILAGPKKKEEKFAIMKAMWNRKRRKLKFLFYLMKKLGEKYNVTTAQIAMAYVSSKNIVPICGCRKLYQVIQLKEATNVKLTEREIKKLEEIADEAKVKILGADLFRFAVKK